MIITIVYPIRKHEPSRKPIVMRMNDKHPASKPLASRAQSGFPNGKPIVDEAQRQSQTIRNGESPGVTLAPRQSQATSEPHWTSSKRDPPVDEACCHSETIRNAAKSIAVPEQGWAPMSPELIAVPERLDTATHRSYPSHRHSRTTVNGETSANQAPRPFERSGMVSPPGVVQAPRHSRTIRKGEPPPTLPKSPFPNDQES